MLGKMIVLKPVVWTSSGYNFPSGIDKKGSDYVATHGFGHEEWNGDAKRLWNGQRVFHTERKGRMEEHGRHGDLGIIMTAYTENGPHALGVATSVQLNTDEERKAIARSLKTAGHAKAMWELPSIRKRFQTFAAFNKFWKNKEHEWISWRCPPEQYAWFSNPVALDPARLFPPAVQGGKVPQIVKMFSSYMAVRPDQAIAVVESSVGEGSPIIDWLRTGEFRDRKSVV